MFDIIENRGEVDRDALIALVSAYVPADIAWKRYHSQMTGMYRRGGTQNPRISLDEISLRGIQVGQRSVAVEAIRKAVVTRRLIKLQRNNRTYYQYGRDIYRNTNKKEKPEATTQARRPWTKRIFEIIGQNGEMSLLAIIQDASRFVPPGQAFREYEKRMQQELIGTFDLSNPERRSAAIRMGSRRIVTAAISSAVNSGRLVRRERNGIKFVAAGRKMYSQSVSQ